MEEQLISFETAKLAKEKGFNLKLKSHWSTYDDNGNLKEFLRIKNLWKSDWNTEKNPYISNKEEILYSAPTQSLLQKWLREIHNSNITIITNYISTGKVYYCGLSYINLENKIDIWFSKNNNDMKLEYLQYEQALEIALQKALKLIK